MRSTPTTGAYWLRLVGLILLIKIAIYLLDAQVGFVLHDSASYLRTALTGWIPPDRSWLYGILVGWVTTGEHNLRALIVIQMLTSAGSCVVLAYILITFLGCSRRITMLGATICALGPSQLLYERYVMTESFSLLAFSLFLTALLLFLRRGNSGTLVVAALLGALAGALRVAYLPAGFGLAALAVAYLAVFGPTVAAEQGAPRPDRVSGMRKGIALLLLMAVIFGSLAVLERSPRQASDGGGFLLSAWSTLLADTSLVSDPELASVIADNPCPYDWENRGRQHWDDGCLMARIRSYYMQQARQHGDAPAQIALIAQQHSNRFARALAIQLLLHHPLRVLDIGLRNWLTLWDPQALRQVLFIDAGGRAADAPFIDTMQTEFGIDMRGRNQAMPPVRRYFSAALPWHWWVISSPLVLLIWSLSTLRSGNPTPLIIAAASTMLLLIITITGSDPSVRLYHGIGWLSLIGLTDIIDRLINSLRGHRIAAHPPTPSRH